MRVKSLSLRNIGPFIQADMEFFTDADAKPPVVLITGENGTGKSIIIDAIRGMFGKSYGRLERNIGRQQCSDQPKIEMILEIEQKDLYLQSKEISENQITVRHKLANVPHQVQQGGECPNWVVDFWPSTLASGSYKVNAFTSPKHNLFLSKALQGTKAKSDITQLICHFDYVRDSRDPREQATGKRLYEILEQIVASSLLNGGKLSHVARATYEPIIIQNGQPVGLANLSGGNSYLIQNLVGLLGKMYSVHVLRETPLDELGQTPGLLLIDEAENQLHPKWQKRFIRTILDIFPNLQIIATTHSPFIIASVQNARLYVCQDKIDHCVVVDETAEYANKPVDEILMSPLFEETLPFSEEISRLITEREQAIKAGDEQERERIEVELQALNPEYFAYFDVDKLLEEIAREGAAA
jgi:predicted ATP-binding protein involved in virulence